MAEGDVIRVMLVDDVADTCDQLAKLLFFEKDIEVIAKASNGREAVATAKEKRPDVVLMDINMPEMDGIQATELILAENPSTQVIIMSVQGETDYLRRAMLAGAREFLVKPISADDLYHSIRHVYKLGQTRTPVAPSRSSGNRDGEDSGDGQRGQVIALFSPKGGTGTSIITANLAVALRQMTQKRVAVVDGNLVLGDQNVILNLVSNRTIVDLANRIADLDSDLLNDVMATHASKVKVLLSPPNPQTGETVTVEHVQTILDFMASEFDYVLVDTQSSFQEKAIAILDRADRIVLLMTLEMTSIKNVKQFFEVAELLGYPSDKMILVLNKADNRLGIKVSDVESNIQRKVSLQIANAPYEMGLSINQGVPLVIDKRDHRTSKDIFALARELSNITGVKVATDATGGKQAAKEEKPRGFLSRIFGFGRS
ncbi:MAG: response regulator/pilus assembly protein [Chloroflexaceae bacterium]|nr:response regulator/pilus assembly protein [Chloroflexaceae bacterium]